jgi:hypothetical protein
MVAQLLQSGSLAPGAQADAAVAAFQQLVASALEPPPPLRARRARGARHFHGTEIIIL